MMNFGSLFTGIGGFDVGFERAGLTCEWQVEKGKQQNEVLALHWPNVVRYGDITNHKQWEMKHVDVICGGDPCPIRSKARSNGPSRHPDLSGYFLEVVHRLQPRWVVRENVPAPDDVFFVSALEAIGYGTIVIRIDAAEITGQSRQRDFIVGRHQTTRQGTAGFFNECQSGSGRYTSRLGTRNITPALTTNRTRYDSRDCYIWEGWLRLLDGDERDALAGFPEGWTALFSESARATFCGNAVVPGAAAWIGKHIVKDQ